MFRLAALAFAAAASVVAYAGDSDQELSGASLDLPLIGAQGGVEINKGSIDGGVALPLGLGAVGLDLGDKRTKRFQRHRRADLSVQLAGIDVIFNDLSGELTPVVTQLTTLVQDTTSPAEELLNQTEAALGSVKSLLSGASGKLTNLTNNLDSVASAAKVPTQQTVAYVVSGIYTDVARGLQAVQDSASSIPGVGPVVSSASEDIEQTLSDIIETLSTLASPLLQTLSTVLGPIEGVLKDAGLEGVISTLNGLL